MRFLRLTLATVLLLSWSQLMGREQDAQAKARDDRTAVYKVKWRDPGEIVKLLRPAMRGALQNNRELGVIILRGPEGDHQVIEQLLREYDHPPKNLEFQFYLIEARSGQAGLRNGVPARVRNVVNEIAALTRYNEFSLLGSPVLRTIEGKFARIQGAGPVIYEVQLQGTSVVGDAAAREIRVGDCRIDIRLGGPAGDAKGDSKPSSASGVFTSFAVPDGGLVVLGASGMNRADTDPTGDVAIITVIEARVVDESS